MHREAGRSGFAEALIVGGGNRRLERISELIDWVPVERLLSPIYASGRGRPSWPVLSMVKVALLQAWYGLGDPGMEEALGDRLSFRSFAGFALDERVPDHSTICRFRKQLVKHAIAEALFAEINSQIERRGLLIKQGTLIDATLITAHAAEPPKQKGGGVSPQDPDANWAKRGKVARFGYKLHLAVDQGSLIVRAAQVTPANVADVDIGHDLVQGDERVVYADKGYVGPRMRQRLKADHIKDRVQHRAARGRPLSPRQKQRNRLIGRIRGRVEGVIGTLKRSYDLARMRYMGLAKNEARTFLTLIAWNLARAADRSA